MIFSRSSTSKNTLNRESEIQYSKCKYFSRIKMYVSNGVGRWLVCNSALNPLPKEFSHLFLEMDF